MRWLISAKPLRGVGVDEFRSAGRRLGEDAEPGERVLAEIVTPLALGHLHPADAAGPVRADKEVTSDLLSSAGGVGEHDARLAAGDVEHLGVADAEADVTAVAVAGVGEVGEHVVLRVEPHRLPDQGLEVDAVAESAKAKVDASVLMSFGQYPVRHARFDEEPDAVALQDAGPHGVLDLPPGAVVNDDGIYPGQRQQVGQHQAGGACADDPDRGHGAAVLGHDVLPSRVTSGAPEGRVPSTKGRSRRSRSLVEVGAEQLADDDAAAVDQEHREVGVDAAHAPHAGQRVGALAHDLGAAVSREEAHHHEGLLGAEGEVHRAAHSGDVTRAAGVPVGEVAAR